MPINNFKLFDEKKANMMTDEEYAINQQRLNGVQSGVASSQLQNKTLYQTALMCYALAQLMAANGYDANDANAVSTFVNNLSLSMVQKVVDKASATDVANQVAGKWVDAKQLGELKANIAGNYLPLLGGTMLGDLILHSDPTQPLQAVTKQYVDGFCRIKTGSYVGTGTYGPSHPTVIICGFKPKMVLFYLSTSTDTGGTWTSIDYSYAYAAPIVGWLDGVTKAKSGDNNYNVLDNGLSFYTSATRNQAKFQNNDDGKTYYWLAIG